MRKIKIKDNRVKPDIDTMIREAIEAIPPVVFPEAQPPFSIPAFEDHDDEIDLEDSIVIYDESEDEHHEVKFKDLLKWVGSKTMGRVQTPRKVFTPRTTDLSDSTDGSTKTFTLDKAPIDHTTVKVHSSDWPMILRPTVDFTIAGKAITLTDEVDAPTAGSTLIVDYYT